MANEDSTNHAGNIYDTIGNATFVGNATLIDLFVVIPHLVQNERTTLISVLVIWNSFKPLKRNF